MPGGSCRDEELLHAIEVAKGGDGDRRAVTKGQAGDFLTSELLSQAIWREMRSTVAPIELLSIEGLEIRGALDLQSCGTEGKPMPKLSFDACGFIGGLNLAHCYLKSIKITDCWLASGEDGKVPKIDAQRCTIVERVEVSGLRFDSSGSSLDLTGSKLIRGCTLSGITGGTQTPFESPHSRGESISFKGARVDGDLEIIDVSLHNGGWEHKDSALNLERVNVTGTLSVVSNCKKGEKVPDVYGQINLRSAVIGGRLRFESLYIKAPPNPKGAEHNQPSAIFGRLMVVQGDVLFRRNVVPATTAVCPRPLEEETKAGKVNERRDVLICGQVDLSDARIEGDLDFRGMFFVRERIRALRCRRSTIGGHLRFGRLLTGGVSFACRVVGETDFTGSKVGGTVTFSGSRHRMSYVTSVTIENSRHKQGQAVNFRYAKLSRDMRFESGKRQCFVEGLSLIGASVEGRLLIGGAYIRANISDGNERKAITANGVVIHGGIEIKEDEFYKSHQTVISGDIRISNARIDGRFIVSGADIESRSPTNELSESKEDTFRQRGVAMWATNTRFGGDLLIHRSGCNEMTVRGEIRLWGATIEGTLFIQGATLLASSGNVTALDCYTADIKKGVEITAYFYRDQAIAKPTVITGIVSFSFAKLQSLRMGSFWTTLSDPDDSSNKELPVVEKKIKEGDTQTSLSGALLLKNMQVEGASTFENLLLKHGGHSRMERDILLRLEQLHVFRPYTVVHATYANFGSRLYVRLNPESVGLINLFAAVTGTIGGQTGLTKDELLREGWGTPRKDWSKDECPAGVGKAWGTLPLDGSVAKSYIVLNLDEFRYTRVNDPSESDPWIVKRWERFKRRGILGQPFAEDIGPRFDWLQRQVNNPSDFDRGVISPYQQLAKVYRDQGHLQRANNIVRARRWLQLVSAPEKHQSAFGSIRPFFQNFIDRVFSIFFGFGYSPTRALVTVFSLWLASFILVSVGVSGWAEKIRLANSPGQGTVATSIQPTVTTHKIEHSSNGTSRTASSTSDDAPAQGHLGMFTRGRKEQSYSVITDEVVTPNSPTPVVTAKNPVCQGFFCNVSDHSEASACHLPSGSGDVFNVMTEGSKAILPFTRLNASASCSLWTNTPWLFRFIHAGLEIFSWIVFPLAAITFSGILREKSDG